MGLDCAVNPPGWLLQATDPGTLRTNDQWFSLTDQMQLGVRVLELDTHWFAVSAPNLLQFACYLETCILGLYTVELSEGLKLPA